MGFVPGGDIAKAAVKGATKAVKGAAKTGAKAAGNAGKVVKGSTAAAADGLSGAQKGAGKVNAPRGPPNPNKIPNAELHAPPPTRGDAPIGNDGHPIELHHRGQQPDSPLDEMTRTDHRGKGNFGANHSNTGQKPSAIDRKAWKQQQRDYWKKEHDSGRFDKK